MVRKRNISIREAILRCVRNGMTQIETINYIKNTSIDATLSRAQIQVWFNRFKSGQISINDNVRKNKPLTATHDNNVLMAKKLIMKNRKITIKEVAEQLEISYGSAKTILNKKLMLKKINCKWIPRILNKGEKEARIKSSKKCVKIFNLIKNRIITEDETFIYYFDPKFKSESRVWKGPGSPTPKIMKNSRTMKKLMLIAFFDGNGMIYHHYVNRGQTINSDYFIKICKDMLQKLKRKRLKRIAAHPILHFDNASCHKSEKTTEFFKKKKIKILEHPPYSPDLAPCDFGLFPRLKKYLRGKVFTNDKDLKDAVSAYLKSIPKSVFEKIYNSWESRWQKCISVDGEYFERM